MKFALSICIPTFNRAEYLSQLLESIVSQPESSTVEIVISDNASTDTTTETVERFKSRHSAITFSSSSSNLGADLNYLRSIELAHGEYCWFMGSDDTMRPGSISAMMEALERKRDIYLCNRIDCDSSMKPIRTMRWLPGCANGSVFDLFDPESAADYFNLAAGIGAVFSFLSSIIFKRSRWNDAPYNDSYTGTLYSHVHKLLSFGGPSCMLEYLNSPLVCSRGSNDSFMGEGKIRRFLYDIDGYLKLADSHFSQQPRTREAFLSILARGHKWFSLKIRVMTRSEQQWHSIREKLSACGFSPLLLAIYDLAGPFKFFLRFPVKVIALLRAHGKIA